MNTYKIYKWTNLITGMSYVGQTKHSLEKRAKRNMSGYRECDKFWEAIQHYGTDCWQVEILWDGLTLEEANVYEEIRDNETLFPYGYNLKTGGLNSEHSPETRKKISENSGMKRPEVRAKVSAAHKGKKLSAKHRKKISENNGMKGKKLSAEHRKKISEGHLGMSQEAFTILVGWLLQEDWSLLRIARELRKSERTILRYAKLVK